jgi:hypothetical protein
MAGIAGAGWHGGVDAVCPDGLVVLAGVGVNVSRFQHRVPRRRRRRRGRIRDGSRGEPARAALSGEDRASKLVALKGDR